MHWVESFSSKQRSIISVHVPLGYPPIHNRSIVIANTRYTIHTVFAVYAVSIFLFFFSLSTFFLALSSIYLYNIFFSRLYLVLKSSFSISHQQLYVRLIVTSECLEFRFTSTVFWLRCSLETSHSNIVPFRYHFLENEKKNMYTFYRHGQNKLFTKYTHIFMYVCTVAI